MTQSHQHLVLVIDDDPDVRESIAEALSEEGFKVATANNGREALKVLQQQETKPCMILLDLMMSTMDGYQFLEAKRTEPSLESLPVALLTASSIFDRSRVGNVPVVAKPIKLPKLINLVSKYC